ncbi:Gfo/Idh/MocA family protein [Steroidobacter sp.]|uniref:Gfo/Idh/MocA family protein n=1 Tax=Steroidobacter sp. TaxID=1978227 RepID=UPI001A592B21|nr:Gfo/Idh/MocA family oxidoreductase [Steroidobacter sp.]MBL8267083.1 Gfo/Idh/MocA family oxidoreductase [Steroidobacter sp.]
MRRRLRLGMVGGGQGAFIGAVHRMAARLDDRFELVAGAFSSDPARAHASAAECYISPERSYVDYQTMVSREVARADRIDAVAIVTPNHLHHGPARAFLDAGIHVFCEKPMTVSVAEAEDLVAAAARSKCVFGLAHTYTGYPMVRQARAMVRSGKLGPIRVVQVEYPQEWLATALEQTGQKQAAWRTDPARSGAGGCIGDIGTHAFQLAEFVSGERCESVAAQLSTFVPGRRLDDDAQMLLRFTNGARGSLWASQVAIGHENGLRLRVYGERASLEWVQEHPNQLRLAEFGKAPQVLTRGGHELDAAASLATRVPSGHPEGYIEAFAQLYKDFAALIEVSNGAAGNKLDHPLPDAEQGLRGMRFIAAAISSSGAGSAWTELGSA